MGDFPQTEADAQVCVHGKRVWFGHECGLCEDAGEHVFKYPVFRWDAAGVDDGGLPAHLPMGLDEHGRGPANDSEAAIFVCWCLDRDCLLTRALRDAWHAGLRGAHVEEA